jgi:hypothetical protein
MDFVSFIEGAASEPDWIAGLTPVIDEVGLRVQGGGS